MKILISYFYQIRFFPRNYIPISTAAFDPKWFHPRDNKKGIFEHQKTGVIYGIRMEEFSPMEIDCDCKKDCEHDPKTCTFLRNYEEWLNNKLNFKECIKNIEYTAMKYNATGDEPIAVLIVYETPDNPCSERVKLVKWFKENGYELDEFDKNKI